MSTESKNSLERRCIETNPTKSEPSARRVETVIRLYARIRYVTETDLYEKCRKKELRKLFIV